MSNSINKINWGYIEKFREQVDAFNGIMAAYGTEVIDPVHSAYLSSDVDIAPKWNVPEKIGISTAITGAFFSKNVNPNQPITPEEIYKSARECCLAGTTVVHIHVRNEQGYNALDPDLFHQVCDPLRKEFPQVMFDACTVPMFPGDWDKAVRIYRERLIDITPINCGSNWFGDTTFTSTPHKIIEKTYKCQEYGVKPMIGIWSDSDIENGYRYLIKPGLIEKPYLWGLLPGLPGSTPMKSPSSMVKSFLHWFDVIRGIDPDGEIQVCSPGRATSYLVTLAILMGCSVRVGMEDTIWTWPHKEDLITSNLQCFNGTKQIAELLGRELATPNEYRRVLGMPEV